MKKYVGLFLLSVLFVSVDAHASDIWHCSIRVADAETQEVLVDIDREIPADYVDAADDCAKLFVNIESEGERLGGLFSSENTTYTLALDGRYENGKNARFSFRQFEGSVSSFGDILLKYAKNGLTRSSHGVNRTMIIDEISFSARDVRTDTAIYHVFFGLE